jgi:DNA-directed RNA polymerase subunit E'/Rpb7
MSYTPEIVSPYRNMLQYTKIQILPHMMNSDIENNMEIVLQKKVEGKCNRYGFIDKVHQIEQYEENIMTPENLSGAASYNITYHCKICIPVENTIIVGTIKAVNPELIIVSNGPIIIFIPKTNIDSNMWNISNEFTHKKKNTILKLNDYVKILIDKTKINQNDVQIKSIGKLLEYATEEEIGKYYGVIQQAETNFIL